MRNNQGTIPNFTPMACDDPRCIAHRRKERDRKEALLAALEKAHRELFVLKMAGVSGLEGIVRETGDVICRERSMDYAASRT